MSLCLALLCLPVKSVAPEAYPVRAWILTDYDMPYNRAVIDRAPEFGINHIQLSHRMMMFVREPAENEAWRNDLAELIDRIHRVGAEAFVWTHELAEVPDGIKGEGRIDLDAGTVYDWLTRKYDRFFTETLPRVDGIVVTLSETDAKVFDDSAVRSSLTVGQRVERLVNAVHLACKQHGKTLVMRTWGNVGTGDWDLLYDIRDGFARTPSDVIIMDKITAGDWYLLARSKLMGTFGDHPQIAEFDLCGEHHGQQRFPWCGVDYLWEEWQWARRTGPRIAGAAGRIDRYRNHTFGKPGEINIHAFSRFLNEPEKTPDTIWDEWTARRYGTDAAPFVRDALRRTNDIIFKTLYVKHSYFMQDHSHVPAVGYPVRHLKDKTAVPWNPIFGPLESMILEPTEESLELVLAEKDEAMALLEAAQADLEAARGSLREADYAQLADELEALGFAVRVFRGLNEVHFRRELCENGAAGQKQELLNNLRDALRRLRELAESIERRYGRDYFYGVPGRDKSAVVPRIEAFIGDTEERLPPPPSR